MKKISLLIALTLGFTLLTPAVANAAVAEPTVTAALTAPAAGGKLTRVTLKAAKKNNRPYLSVTGNVKTLPKKTPLRIRNAVTKKVIRTCTTVTKCSTYLSPNLATVYATWGKKKTAVYRVPKTTSQQTRKTLPVVLRQDAQAAAVTLRALPTNPAAQLADAARKSYSAADIRRALPKGTTITPDTGTWMEQVGYGTGTMRVTVKRPGKQAATYTAIMVQNEIGDWKFLTTLAAS